VCARTRKKSHETAAKKNKWYFYTVFCACKERKMCLSLSSMHQNQINQMFCCAPGNHTICRAVTKRLAQLNRLDTTMKVIYSAGEYELTKGIKLCRHGARPSSPFCAHKKRQNKAPVKTAARSLKSPRTARKD
jgi:hypothetical protein